MPTTPVTLESWLELNGYKSYSGIDGVPTGEGVYAVLGFFNPNGKSEDPPQECVLVAGYTALSGDVRATVGRLLNNPRVNFCPITRVAVKSIPAPIRSDSTRIITLMNEAAELRKAYPARLMFIG